MISVVIVDDQPAVRRGLHMRLALEPDLQIVGEACTGTSALKLVRATRPDVVILDVDLPGMDGITTALAVQHVAPECAVVILTIADSQANRTRALAAGARAFIGKHEDPDLLLAAVRSAAQPARERTAE